MDIEKKFRTEFYDYVVLGKEPENEGSEFERRLLTYKGIEQDDWNAFEYSRYYGDEIASMPVVKTGPIAGFRPLHLACYHSNTDIVKELVEDFYVDVNVAAEDGIQPIQLACLFGHADIVKILGEAGANINAEITHDMFSKYVTHEEWCSDFDNKMTLITYAITVLYEDEDLIQVLMNLKPNLKIKSSRNKTLLMYLLLHGQFASAGKLALNKEYEEYINIRDDDGLHFLHYVLHPDIYGDYRYVGSALGEWDLDVYEFIFVAGGDIDYNVTVNNDSDTLLINKAAYRSSSSTLSWVLPYYKYTSTVKSKALYYSTLPPGDPDKYFLPTFETKRQEELVTLEEQRIESQQLILKDLINRFTFGLPVPEEEKKLFDELVLKDTEVRNYVDDYKKNFIEGTLKNTVIQYDDKKITYHDFIMESFNEIKLRILMRNKSFLKAFSSTRLPFGYTSDYDYFRHHLYDCIPKAYQRVQLLNELKDIPHLRKVLPLPYEWILDIVDDLSNEDLKNFISAFYVEFNFDMFAYNKEIIF